jgi:large subunit ribosomal protein L5
MQFLENFSIKILKYELINKFFYSNTNQLPKIKNIILNFGCKTADLKELASSLLALKLITNKKGKLTTTKYSNIKFKIRKGNATGCKIILSKFQMFNFFSKTIIEVFPKLKNFNGFILLNNKIKKNTFSFEIKDNFCFPELENNYYLFKNLPKLNITIILTSNNKIELVYILKSFQLPFKN